MISDRGSRCDRIMRASRAADDIALLYCPAPGRGRAPAYGRTRQPADERRRPAYNAGMDTYDPRYLAGILKFNEGDFFEAHELWEDLWSEGHGDARRFYQGLIQAAVGLCHYCNGNLNGAVKLYHSARDYMQPCRPHFLGLDVADFWRQMEHCFAPILQASSTA